MSTLSYIKLHLQTFGEDLRHSGRIAIFIEHADKDPQSTVELSRVKALCGAVLDRIHAGLFAGQLL